MSGGLRSRSGDEDRAGLVEVEDGVHIVGVEGRLEEFVDLGRVSSRHGPIIKVSRASADGKV